MDYWFKFDRKQRTSAEDDGYRQQLSKIQGDPRVHDNQHLREADEKLKEFIDRMSCNQSFDWLLDPIMILLIVFMCFMRGGFVIAAFCLVVMIGLLVYKQYAIRSFTRQISDSRLTAGVLYKIMLGPDELEKIYQYVPIPWRWLFLMLKPKKVADWVFLVAQNLAWYQQEPKLYLPARWIVQTVLGVIAVCSYAITMFGSSSSYNGHGLTYLQIAFVPLMILIGLGNKLKLAGSIALRAELESVLPPRKRTPLKAEDI